MSTSAKMTFECRNDGMITGIQIAAALHEVANYVSSIGDEIPEDGARFTVRDLNGNTVGFLVFSKDEE